MSGNIAENDIREIPCANVAEALKIDSSSKKSSRRKSVDHLNKENDDIQFETPS